MQIRRAVRCPTCGASYIEAEGERCPVCARGGGVVRSLQGGEGVGDMPPAAVRMGARAQSQAPAPLAPDAYACGWLVVREGAQRGRSFRLTARKNAIAPDAAPGAHGHGASVLYDPVGNAFYALNADGPDLAYVNGDVLLAPRPLRAGDILRVGGTSLRFVPFCGARFRWDVGSP